MVCYCCVKGCNNSSYNKKGDPDAVISFHVFPSNKELKLKWLKAIGRPNWDPPNHTRICSAHFSFDQINHDRCRTRIKDDAFPIIALPPNSNFEASHLEVCRICLDTNIKMYSLRNGLLKTCMETIAGFNKNHNIEGLPQFVCYICAANLLRCYNLIEKSMIAQATLLDIFAQNGQITINLIKKQNRKELNLTSPLKCYINKNVIELNYNDEKNKFWEIKLEKDNEINIDSINSGIESEQMIGQLKFEEITSMAIEGDDDDIKLEDKGMTIEGDGDIKVEVKGMTVEGDDDHIKFEDKGSPAHSINSEDVEIQQPLDMISKNKPLNNNQVEAKGMKRKKSIDEKGLTPHEVKMQKHFNIVKLSFKQQVEEWNKSSGNKSSGNRAWKSTKLYECDICHKVCAHYSTFQTHFASHDPSRGKAECPVCKLRFKNQVRAKSHANRTHGKKFFCKICPKSFSNVHVAKKHLRSHAGHVYHCPQCAFSTLHESSLGVHMRSAHTASHVCVRCGRACVSARGLALHAATVHRGSQEAEGNEEYRCEQCDINFVSEGARRFHLLTSSQHRKKTDLCDATFIDPSVKTTCNTCAAEFSNTKDLITHIKAEHPRTGKKTSWSLSGDSYPTHCEHCGEVVNNRREHWLHVLRQHPKEKDSYRPVITTICDTCGKGFQNPTKLHLHSLRHAAPSVRCSQCPRTFYDKYGLRRHAAAVHCGRKPHRCHVCGRAFGQRGNLDRHLRVHSEATPYECSLCGKKFKYSTSKNLHIRTVHKKLPHPPRKKKSKVSQSTSATSAQENSDI